MILGPGDFSWRKLPERPSAAHGQRHHTMTECSIVRLEKVAMVRVLYDEAKFADVFIAHLKLQRNGRIEERI